MVNRKVLKKEAKKKMQGGKWIKISSVALGAQLVCAMAMVALGYAGFQLVVSDAWYYSVGGILSLLLFLFILVPIEYGIYRYAQQLWRGEDKGIRTIFASYRYLGAILRAYLWKNLWLFLWSTLFLAIIMSIARMIGVEYPFGERGYEFSMRQGTFFFHYVFSYSEASFFLFLVNIVILIKNIQYAQVPFVIGEHPELGAIQALKRSKSIMKGRKWKLFILYMSFFPWFLVMAIPLALLAWCNLGYFSMYNQSVAWIMNSDIVVLLSKIIPFVTLNPIAITIVNVLGGLVILLVFMYLMPYMNVTFAGFYDEIKKEKLEKGILLPEDFNETTIQ